MEYFKLAWSWIVEKYIVAKKLFFAWFTEEEVIAPSPKKNITKIKLRKKFTKKQTSRRKQRIS